MEMKVERNVGREKIEKLKNFIICHNITNQKVFDVKTINLFFLFLIKKNQVFSITPFYNHALFYTVKFYIAK